MADKNSKADTQPQEQQDKNLTLSKPGESSQPGEPEEPSTGGSSPVLLFALVAAMSALAVLVLRRKLTRD